MTQATISMETATEICKGHLKLLQLVFGITGYLGGGFLRDVENGVEPKDIDIFIEGRGQDVAALDQLATAFYAAIGYSCKPMGAYQRDAEYPLHLRVYEAVGCPEDQYPVQLIMTPQGRPHTMEFDIGFCEIYCWYNSHRDRLEISRPQSYKQDCENKTLTIQRINDPMFEVFEDLRVEENFIKAFDRHVNHLQRLKAKYPENTVVFDVHFLQSEIGQKAYPLYLERGLIENPRTILPTEAERAHWDALRQQDGEAFARELRDIEARAARDLAARAERDNFFAQLAHNPEWPAGLQAGRG